MSVQNHLFVEKYRPETLDDIIGHESIVTQMESWVDDPSTPHILFSGPQGVGKTAIIQAFAREKYGNNWRNNVLELNASDERGIGVVRDRIKQFARQSTAVGSDASYKIIFLDEADQLTSDAQPALRRVMEDYSDVSRFFMSVNYLNQVIEPIQSRCATFNVSRLDDSEIKTLLDKVIREEGIDMEEQLVWDLVDNSRGDARAALNTLQAAELEGEITRDSLSAVTSVVNDELTEELVDEAAEGDYGRAMERLDNEILMEGVDPETVTKSFQRVLKRKDDWPQNSKIAGIDAVGEADWRILQGGSPEIHLHNLLTQLHLARHSGLDSYD